MFLRGGEVWVKFLIGSFHILRMAGEDEEEES